MMAGQNRIAIARDQVDSGTIVAVVGAIAVVFTGFITGLWQWLSGRKKSNIDAQASLVAGFVALLTSVQNERDRLLARITECESDNQKQDRRISKLERLIRQHGGEVPGDDS